MNVDGTVIDGTVELCEIPNETGHEPGRGSHHDFDATFGDLDAGKSRPLKADAERRR